MIENKNFYVKVKGDGDDQNMFFMLGLYNGFEGMDACLSSLYGGLSMAHRITETSQEEQTEDFMDLYYAFLEGARMLMDELEIRTNHIQGTMEVLLEFAGREDGMLNQSKLDSVLKDNVEALNQETTPYKEDRDLKTTNAKFAIDLHKLMAKESK